MQLLKAIVVGAPLCVLLLLALPNPVNPVAKDPIKEHRPTMRQTTGEGIGRERWGGEGKWRKRWFSCSFLLLKSLLLYHRMHKGTGLKE